jgi:H+/Na+-translocating ferredoxin:NAD+ oxidoreductase subunit G
MIRYMLFTAILLCFFALTGTGIVAFTHDNTADRIAINERAALLESLHAIVPSSLIDNDITSDTITVRSKDLLGSSNPVTVYRARKDGKPVAAIFAPVAPDGYNGDIKLLVAISYQGEIFGVRVISHRETPGLGDAIDTDKSDWIDAFRGHSLAKPSDLGWHVKRDGGDFDQFTGATITPRAVVKAVYNSLQYFKSHRDELFASGSVTSGTEHDPN